MKPELLARYADRPLPRYTSYPTAPHFKAGIDSASYRARLATLPAGSQASLYFHVPFCRSMCWYCGCHTTITARDEPIARYLDSLHAEMAMVADAMPGRIEARHIHFGGGTPTLMKPDQFRALMDAIRARFDLADDAEVAIEIDPRTLEPEMVRALGKSGVTRASLGVQSFDPVVQRAINRVQTYEQTALAVERLRAAGVRAINFDLIYGLPHQTVESCWKTALEALTLGPDRFAVFGYAHVPSFKLHQRKIEEAALPSGAERHAQAQAICEALTVAGYRQIGLDHFARRSDALAVAQEEGALRRNFQGYTTDDCETLLGFGASSIGRLPQGYVQNAVLIGDWQRRIAAGELAVTKNCDFAGDDRLRAAVIERIMCDYRVDLDELCGRFGADAGQLLATTELEGIVADGVARRRGHVLSVPDDARPLVRVLAAAFDSYLGHAQARHSRAV